VEWIPRIPPFRLKLKREPNQNKVTVVCHFLSGGSCVWTQTVLHLLFCDHDDRHSCVLEVAVCVLYRTDFRHGIS
jgi:hypothetical protein